jgi:antitoxin component of RelBE/YafQ-DinJ toxin-antitoxin module
MSAATVVSDAIQISVIRGIRLHPSKVTIDISDALLRKARKLAAREGVTLSILVERVLGRVVGENKKPVSFKLRRAGFNGKGLQAEFRDAPWETLSEAAYESRGG